MDESKTFRVCSRSLIPLDDPPGITPILGRVQDLHVQYSIFTHIRGKRRTTIVFASLLSPPFFDRLFVTVKSGFDFKALRCISVVDQKSFVRVELSG